MSTTKKPIPFFTQRVLSEHSLTREDIIYALADFMDDVPHSRVFNSKSKLVKLVTLVGNLLGDSEHAKVFYATELRAQTDTTIKNLWTDLIPLMPLSTGRADYLRNLCDFGEEADWGNLYPHPKWADMDAMQRFEDTLHGIFTPKYAELKVKAKQEAETVDRRKTDYEKDFGPAIELLHSAGIKFITTGADPALQKVVTNHVVPETSRRKGKSTKKVA